MQNILIFGGSGMLGTYLCDYLGKFHHVTAVSRNEYNVVKDDLDKLRTIITSFEPTIVINCIALLKNRNPTYLESIKVNTVFPHQLSFICESLEIKFIHISTNDVFEGTLSEMYKESNKKLETEQYNITKSMGEPHYGMIIRTSIIGEEKTSKLSLIEQVKLNKGKEMVGWTNHYWNGVTALELSKYILHIMKDTIISVNMTISNVWLKGIKHIASPNIVSKYELILIINEVFKLDIKIKKADADTRVNKTLSSEMKDTFQILPIKDQIKELYDYNILKEDRR